MRRRGWAGKALSAISDNWISRSYLSVCAVLVIWAAVDAAFVTHGDASLAGVWPAFATAPTSLLLLSLPGMDGPLLLIGISAAAFVNASVLGLLVRSVRRNRTSCP